MERSTIDLWVGLFMIAGLGALTILALKVGNMGSLGSSDTYQLSAEFTNIGGLKPRARVTMAGVTVGRVEAIELDREWYDARVVLSLNSDLEGQLSQDTTAAILTAGLLGEQYIGLSVGGAPEVLQDGDTIRDTQSALVLEELIQQFVSNMVSN